MEYQAKLNEKNAFLYCISSFEGTSYKKLQFTAPSSFISCCFTSAFTSADVFLQHFTSYKLVQHYLKKDFRPEFFFFTRFNQIYLIPLTAKIR